MPQPNDLPYGSMSEEIHEAVSFHPHTCDWGGQVFERTLDTLLIVVSGDGEHAGLYTHCPGCGYVPDRKKWVALEISDAKT